jgi:hypothetical protein
VNMYFDLIDSQRTAREIRRPKMLYEFWEWASLLYENQLMRAHELDEIRAVVRDQFRHLEALRQVAMTTPTRLLGSH